VDEVVGLKWGREGGDIYLDREAAAGLRENVSPAQHTFNSEIFLPGLITKSRKSDYLDMDFDS
jgi:hypothetical protein